MQTSRSRVYSLLALTLVFAGCSSTSSRYSYHQDSAPDQDIDVSRIPDATPRHEPRSKYGNPDSYVVKGRRYYVMDDAQGYVERGIASWYGKKFHGHRTSSGEPYNMYAMTAAHTRLPLPAYVQVTNLQNQSTVVVRVNDRGPFHPNRIIDLSYAAAKKLGITAQGTAMVEVRAIGPGKSHSVANKPASYAPLEQAEFQLYLQVGAFVSRRNAEQLQQKLRNRYAALNINARYSEENKVYRVRIGPLASVAEADRLAETLSRQGFTAPHIVVD
jgi:rare lipoprotein A